MSKSKFQLEKDKQQSILNCIDSITGNLSEAVVSSSGFNSSMLNNKKSKQSPSFNPTASSPTFNPTASSPTFNPTATSPTFKNQDGAAAPKKQDDDDDEDVTDFSLADEIQAHNARVAAKTMDPNSPIFMGPPAPKNQQTQMRGDEDQRTSETNQNGAQHQDMFAGTLRGRPDSDKQNFLGTPDTTSRKQRDTIGNDVLGNAVVNGVQMNSPFNNSAKVPFTPDFSGDAPPNLNLSSDNNKKQSSDIRPGSPADTAAKIVNKENTVGTPNTSGTPASSPTFKNQDGTPIVAPGPWTPFKNQDGTPIVAPTSLKDPEQDKDFVGPPSSLKDPEQDKDFVGPPSSLKDPEQDKDFVGPPSRRPGGAEDVAAGIVNKENTVGTPNTSGTPTSGRSKNSQTPMRGDEDQGTSETNQMITYNYPDQAQHQDMFAGTLQGRPDPDKQNFLGTPNTTGTGIFTSKTGDFEVKPPTNAAPTNPGFMTSPQGVPSPKSTKTNAKPPKQKPKVIENPDEIEPPPYEPPTLNKGNFLSPKYSSENAALSKNPNTLFSNPSLSLRDQYAANRKSSNPNVVRGQEIVDRENAEAEANKQTGTNGRNIGDMRKENEQYAQAAKNRGEPPIGSAEWVTWNRAKNQKRLDDAGINQTVDQVTHPFPTKTPNIKNENGVYYDQRDIVPGSNQDLRMRGLPTKQDLEADENQRRWVYSQKLKAAADKKEEVRLKNRTPGEVAKEEKDAADRAKKAQDWKNGAPQRKIERDNATAASNAARSEANRQRKINAKLRKGETLTDEEMSPPKLTAAEKAKVAAEAAEAAEKAKVAAAEAAKKNLPNVEPLPVANADSNKKAGDMSAAEALQDVMNNINKPESDGGGKKEVALNVTDPRRLLAQAKQRKPESNETALSETYYNLRNKTLKEDIGEDIKDVGKTIADYIILPSSMRNAAMRGEMGELGHTEKNAQEFNDHIASGMSNGLGLLTKFLPAAAMSKLNSLVGGIPGLELDVIIPRLATQMAHDFRSDPKPIADTLRDKYKANKEAEKAKALGLKKASTPSPTPTQTPTPTPTPTQTSDGKTYATNKKTPKFTIRPGISLA